MSTFLHLLTFGVLIFGHLAMAAWLMQVGARWAQADGGSFWRAVGVLVLMTVVVAVADWGFGKLFGASIERSLYAASMTLLAMNFLLSLWVVQRAFRVSLGQAFQIWLPTLVSTLVFGIASIFFVVPYLVEAFKVPTNSMAPAILGRHLTGDCPLCGGRAILPASSVENGALPEDLAICTACRRVSSIPIPTGPIQSGDRLLVSKPLAPRRWDIIVYRRPSDPSTSYVTRLVGLPGEELAIRDGGVWINGERLAPSPDVDGIVYSPGAEGVETAEFGPVSLGPDESFVLGDFSLRANDSRMWPTGAPGHPAHAVPSSHLIGTVTHIYWPPSRWRIVR